MTTTLKHPFGDVDVKWTNDTGSAVSSGDPIFLQDDLLYIANGDIANGDEGVIQYGGRHELAKEAPLAFSAGANVYWDAANSRLTTTSAGNKYAGRCHEGATSAATTAWVDINVPRGPELPGSVPAGISATASAIAKGEGVLKQVVITFTDLAITITDEAGVIGYGGVKVFDFDEGNLAILGASLNLTSVAYTGGINADADGDVAVGTVTAANDADLTSTEADIIPKTTVPQATGGATTATARSTAASFHDGTSTAKDAFLNWLIDDLDQDGGGTVTVSGTLTLNVADYGDY